MSASGSVNINELIEEAGEFRLLLEGYLADRRFLEGHPDRHLLYFIDAHDLKSFIEPDRLKRVHDRFALRAERAVAHRNPEPFLRSIQWINDQIIGDLVLDQQDAIVGVLPPHVEELDETLIHHQNANIGKKIELIFQAKQQVARIRRETVRRAEAAFNALDATSVTAFFQRTAPAVLALVRPRPETVEMRANRLQDASRLRLPDDIDWTRFGLPPEVDAELRAYVAEPERDAAWRRFLNGHRREHGSQLANRRDAEAIAWVEGLNERLKEFSDETGQDMRVRVRLVTHAWNLSALAAGKGGPLPGLMPANFMRHPRLTLLHNSIAALREGQAATDHPEQLLELELRAYELQLPQAAGDPLSAARPMVGALHDFEKTRFAVDLHNPESESVEPEQPLTDKEMQELLRIFRNYDGAVAELKSKLMQSVRDFSNEVVGLRKARSSGVPPAICRPGPTPEHVWLFSRGIGFAGMVAFPEALLRPPSATQRPLPGAPQDDGVNPVVDHEVWNYMRRALTLASGGDVALAQVYADTANKLGLLREAGSFAQKRRTAC